MSRNAEIPALGALVVAWAACVAGGPERATVDAGIPRGTPDVEERAVVRASIPSPAQLERWVDSVVTETMAADRIPGAAVVWVSGVEPVLSKAYGVAEVDASLPVTVDGTIFRIGSISKVVTAIALTQLIDEGVVGLDDPIGNHLPDLRTRSPSGSPILVRHLLSHSGGFDQVGERRQVDDPLDRPTIREFLERELVPVREPGEVAVYDTYGITLAGHLVERVSGRSFGDYLRLRVFEPLGMRSTWLEVPPSERDRLAAGYGLENGTLEAQPYEWYVTLPASSVDATAADMGRLLTALLSDGGGILSPRMAERVRTKRLLSYGEMGAFSWGFWEEAHRGYRALHHGGIMRGYSSELYLVPEAEVGFYVSYNRDPETGPPTRLREALVDLLYDRVLPPPTDPMTKPAGPLLAAPAGRVSGVYGSTAGCFTCDEGEGWPIPTVPVAADSPGVITLYGGSARFFATDTLVYRSEASGRELRFLTDGHGRVRYMVQGPNSFARLDDVLLDELLGHGWRDRPVEPIAARVYRATEDWAAAARAYGALAARIPANGRFAFYEGFSLLHTADWEAARNAFRRALNVGQWTAWSQYYIAGSFAGVGEADAAWRALDRAIEMGFNDANLLRTEPWWQRLRETDEYRAALSRLGA